MIDANTPQKTCLYCPNRARFRGVCGACAQRARARGIYERLALPPTPPAFTCRVIRNDQAWPPSWLRVTQVAALLRCSVRTVYRRYPTVVIRRRDGRLAGVGVHRKYVEKES